MVNFKVFFIESKVARGVRANNRAFTRDVLNCNGDVWNGRQGSFRIDGIGGPKLKELSEKRATWVGVCKCDSFKRGAWGSLNGAKERFGEETVTICDCVGGGIYSKGVKKRETVKPMKDFEWLSIGISCFIATGADPV